jgi:hypothetical protein
MSGLYCCEVCGLDPHWEIVRRGDVVVTWACDEHLTAACDGLQREFEVTTLLVEDFRRLREGAKAAPHPPVMTPLRGDVNVRR